MVPGRHSTTVPGSPNCCVNLARTSAAASGENGAKFFGDKMKSVFVWSSMALANVAFVDSPTMAITLTSASPIINAAAVDAVRRGFRMAFCRASMPVTLLSRSAGHVSSITEGTAKSGLSIATPMNTIAAAMPTATGAVLSLPPKSATAISTSSAPVNSVPHT